jgi:Fic family protein
MQDSIHGAPLSDEIDRHIIELLRDHRSGCTAQKLLASLADRGHGISQPTLSRRLGRLEAGRHVIAHMAGRSTLYKRDPYHDWFSLPPTRRPKVAYNFDILDGYEPNETYWLTPDETEQLQAAGGARQFDASTYSRAIAQKLLVDLAYASSALEGNTYSYLDTQVLIEYGKAAEGKAVEETQMILNHKEAISYLIDNIEDIEISPREFKTLQALLSRGLIEPAAVGDIRKRPVDIGGSAYVPLSIPQKLEEELVKIATKARAIENAFEQSLFLMTFISYLQAFQDVNKRTGRLACNIPLLKNGFAPLSFMEMDRTHYVEGLLAFYELNRIDLLKKAYIEGYITSAARYDAYTGRDRSTVELEFRRREDIYGCVKAYVEKSVANGRRIDLAAFARECFRTDSGTVRTQLTERVTEIVAALQEGNHIAYGVSRKVFDRYTQLP